MLTTEERRLELVGLVQKMRTAQKNAQKAAALLQKPRGKFFKSSVREDIAEYQAVLEDANYHERQVDRALLMLRQRELFDA